jgi:predicted nucleic acid-binding Zn finger protein
MITIYKQKLLTVYNKAVSKAKKAELDNKDKLIQRIHKAFGILQHHDYYVAERSQYEPTKHSCGCPDYVYRLRHLRKWEGQCKHMIAETLKERIDQMQFIQLDFFNPC